MRGWPVSGDAQYLAPNTSGIEAETNQIYPNSTGFSTLIGGGTYIYVAIRRGPMKVPTVGTTVFAPIARTGNATATNVTTGFTTDLVIDANRTRSSFTATLFFDRLRGSTRKLASNTTAAEGSELGMTLDTNNGIKVIGTDSFWNNSGVSYIYWTLRRAPSFFDIALWTGDGSYGRTINHNLGVTPELTIVKSINGDGVNWYVNATPFTNWTNGYPCGFLNLTDTITGNGNTGIKNPTSTTFEVNHPNTNTSNSSYNLFVAYLFATCAGVSKVGSYTGTGALQTVNCGFTSGARFVLIKRIDSTGGWYVWDSARGITSGNDPYLLINDTAAEVTNTNYVDTDSTGFKVTAAAPAALNASGGSYFFFAIA
jgi:hypothetical protein